MNKLTFWLFTTLMTLLLFGGIIYLWLGEYGKNTVLMAFLTLIVVNVIAKWIYHYLYGDSKKFLL